MNSATTTAANYTQQSHNIEGPALTIPYIQYKIQKELHTTIGCILKSVFPTYPIPST